MMKTVRRIICGIHPLDTMLRLLGWIVVSLVER